MEKYIMALDQGTTSSRTILFNKKGEIVCQANKEFEQIFPKAGWVEHNPWEIWNSQLFTMREVMTQAGIEGSDIEAVGITNQRETTIVWDKYTGEPVYNAIVWQCRRTSNIIDDFMDRGLDKLIRDKTGLIPDAYFSGTKIKWILDNVEGAKERAKKGELLFGTVDSWLIWRLSGGKVHATDYTNASRTMIYNIYSLEWDNELLNLLDIPAGMLPKVLPSSGVFGYVEKKLFGAEIPISGVAGDQQAALFGQCCFEKGDVKNTYGTGCFLLMNTGSKAVKSGNGLITTIAAGTGSVEYALEGSVFVAGAAIQWLRDQMKIIDSASNSETVAEKVPDSNGVYVVPAFTGMGAPYWKQDARGMVVGITRGTKREHFVRAVLESLAYQTYDLLMAMEQDLGEVINTVRVDGGASANNLLMQFQADISKKRVVRPQMVETTGLGAAYLAGLATGYWKNKEDIIKNVGKNTEFVRKITSSEAKEKIKGWQRAVKCAIAYCEE